MGRHVVRLDGIYHAAGADIGVGWGILVVMPEGVFVLG
jgi:hypothetical protein